MLKINCIKNPKINLNKLKYCAPQIRQTANNITLADGFGNTLSSAMFFTEKDTLTILDLESQIKNKGYGTKIINSLKEKFNGYKINLSACWERFDNIKPPHKFYMKNGFVPTDEKAAEKLTSWINNGAKTNEFPIEYEICEMTFTPKA